MILVTGGAGYIGSHVTRDLLDNGYSVLVLDNLSTGHLEAVDKRATFIFGDTGDSHLLNCIFNTFKIEAVMHFAANCLVGESVTVPLKYYQNNVRNTIQLLESMMTHNIKKLIFSSTCAIYGISETFPITEQTPNHPINPYGKSKLMIENVLEDVSKSNGLNYIALRYFNVAGAHDTAEIGEHHDPETHLIPNIMRHLQGKSDYIDVFGFDHDTEDGTCIRDYIHVMDLSKAHILALQYLLKYPEKPIHDYLNVGTEKGYSVLEIIQTCEEIAKKKATIKIKPRREGDPPKLVASSHKIKTELGWVPQYNLKQIIKTAWKWHKNKPSGYTF